MIVFFFVEVFDSNSACFWKQIYNCLFFFSSASIQQLVFNRKLGNTKSQELQFLYIDKLFIF